MGKGGECRGREGREGKSCASPFLKFLNLPLTGTHKFDHGLSHLLHEKLHWFDVPGRIHYKLGVTVHHCLQ